MGDSVRTAPNDTSASRPWGRVPHTEGVMLPAAARGHHEGDRGEGVALEDKEYRADLRKGHAGPDLLRHHIPEKC